MEWGLVVGILVILEGFIILRGLQMLSAQIEAGLDDLDATLAEAIQSVVQNLGVGEPINPIQHALAQILTNSVSSSSNIGPGDIIEVAQGSDGRFVGKE